MIVYRAEFEVKIGRSGDAVRSFKWVREQLGKLGAYRICYNTLGEGHRLAIEKEFEDLEGYQAWWTAFSAAYAQLEPPTKLADTVDGWKCREIWRVIGVFEVEGASRAPYRRSK